MIELPDPDTDVVGLLSALWSAGTALTSEAAAMIADLAERLEAAERRAEAAARDRDYWREQHDATLADWKADLAELSARTPPAADDDGGDADLSRRMLLALLRFYDPRTGAVSGRAGTAFLCDAFAEAAELSGRGRG